MLRKLRDDFSPEYLAAVSISERPRSEISKRKRSRRSAVRHQNADFKESQYDGYKANRAEMPRIVQQIPYIRRAIEGYRIPILQLAGYEADDVIEPWPEGGRESYPVFVVSSDKDMLQLVNDKVQY